MLTCSCEIRSARYMKSALPLGRYEYAVKLYYTKIKMPNGWRTINSLVHKIRLHGRRGKGMAESFSRQKSRHAPQKEGGLKILCDLPPVWPRLVRPTNLMSRMDGKKTHTHYTLGRYAVKLYYTLHSVDMGKKHIPKLHFRDTALELLMLVITLLLYPQGGHGHSVRYELPASEGALPYPSSRSQERQSTPWWIFQRQDLWLRPRKVRNAIDGK